MKNMDRIVLIIFFQLAVIGVRAIAWKGVGIGTTDPDGSATLPEVLIALTAVLHIILWPLS
jgi:hypothetical protein